MKSSTLDSARRNNNCHKGTPIIYTADWLYPEPSRQTIGSQQIIRCVRQESENKAALLLNAEMLIQSMNSWRLSKASSCFFLP